MSFRPNIYNIPANYHFLQSLFSWLEDNFSQEEFSNLTILLPNRRTVREFLSLIKNENKTKRTFILPKVKAIGDLDFEDFIDGFAIKNEASFFELKNVIADLVELKVAAPIKYLLFLTEKIRDFDKTHQVFGKNIGFEQYFSIAINVANLFDEIEKNAVDLEKLAEIDDAEISKHQQFILKFLRDFYFEIKNSLIKKNLFSYTSYQAFVTNSFSALLEKNGAKNPIIIAGSTGSISYGKKLIKAISKQKNCHVILYGLDKENFEVEKNHAQFVLKELLDVLQVEKIQIADLKKEDFALCFEARNAIISLAMLPHFLIDRWNKIDENFVKKSLQNIDLIECEDDFEEAKIISLALQKANFENKNCALICNDEKLIELVKLQLINANLAFNDTTSQIILQKPIVDFILTILRLIEDFDSQVFLALLKNNLCFSSGLKYQNDLQKLELQIFRQPREIRSLDNLEKIILADFSQKDSFIPIVKILQKLQNSLRVKSDLSQIFSLIVEAAESLANKALGDFADQEIIDLINDLKSENIDLQNVNLANFSRSLFSTISSFFAEDESCKISILSTIEARLLNHDLTIISGLNEGIFPQIQAQNWLGKKIRADLAVDNIGREIGVNAYDFVNHFCNKEVILTRSTKSKDVENIASRFVLKLQILAKKFSVKISDGAYYKEILRNLAEKDKNILAKILQPNPKINKELLPQSFAITDFTKLMSDPYSIYAKKILKLEVLKEVNYEVGKAEFGSFVHKVLERFNPEKNQQEFLQEAKIIFCEYFVNEELQLLWWSKFENIFAEFLEENQQFLHLQNQVEIPVKMEIFVEDFGFLEIKGRVDRLIIDENGLATLFDYKTGGTLPTKKDAEAGLQPQLALSALLIENDEKTVFLRDKIKELKYWKLSFNDKGEIKTIFKDCPEVRLVIDEAFDGVKKLLQFFATGNGFISCYNSEKYNENNDYHHLARVDEWSI